MAFESCLPNCHHAVISEEGSSDKEGYGSVREQHGDDPCSCTSICPLCTSLRFCLPVFLGLGWSQRNAWISIYKKLRVWRSSAVNEQTSKARMAAKTCARPSRGAGEPGETVRELWGRSTQVSSSQRRALQAGTAPKDLRL